MFSICIRGKGKGKYVEGDYIPLQSHQSSNTSPVAFKLKKKKVPRRAF